MGGMISSLSAIQRPDLFHGLVLSSPAIGLDASKNNVVNLYVAPILSELIPKVLNVSFNHNYFLGYAHTHTHIYIYIYI